MATTTRFRAHPQSAPGDFYVVNGECVCCGAPHAVAPDLISWAANTESEHCIWKKQPESDAELEQALAVFAVSEVGCHRYAGNDVSIIEKIGAEYCDHALPVSITHRAEPPADVRFTLIDSPGPIRKALSWFWRRP
jgi:hypothetical protein